MRVLTPGTVIARLYVPMEMGAFARILSAIAKEFPGAVLTEPSVEGEVIVSTPPIPVASEDPSASTFDPWPA